MELDVKQVRQINVASNKIITYWLGGSGFIFKFDSGITVCIDPYLSNSVEKLCGFKRLTLPPLNPCELRFDVLLITHDHPDHLDIDIINDILEVNPNSYVIAPQSCSEKINHEHRFIAAMPDKPFDICGLTVKTVPADHGELSPDAVGYLMCMNNRTIYFTGDTALNEDILQGVINVQPEIVVPCINGAYGNLSEEQAAILLQKCNAKIAMPSHFWLFAEHGGSPQKFLDYTNTYSPQTKVFLLTPGRGQII